MNIKFICMDNSIDYSILVFEDGSYAVVESDGSCYVQDEQIEPTLEEWRDRYGWHDIIELRP